VTRDEAIRIAVMALAEWHHRDHGELRTCVEGECFGYQAAAAVDALMAGGLTLNAFEAPVGPYTGPPL
jgi:hypothetical protein